MKFFIVLCVVAAAAAIEISNEYLPPTEAIDSLATDASIATLEGQVLPETSFGFDNAESYVEPAHTFSDVDGYAYKTVRRVIRRRRQAENEYLPPASNNDYLPPVADAAEEAAPAADNFAYTGPQTFDAAEEASPIAPADEEVAAAVEPAHTFNPEDGYSYKTQRRVVYRYRNRRDVSHLPQENEYLPPASNNDYLPPAAGSAPAPVVEQAPVEEPRQEIEAPAEAPAPAPEAAAPEPEPAHTFSENNGYSYKTQRRVVYRYRNRRQADEYPTNEYLPPTEVAASSEYLAPEAAPAAIDDAAHTFSEADGYRYKTHRRRVIRRRY